jgi:hypothetical protein
MLASVIVGSSLLQPPSLPLYRRRAISKFLPV